MARLKLSEDLLPLSDLEALEISSEHRELQHAVDEAEWDIAEGRWVENSDVLAKLKRWSASEQ